MIGIREFGTTAILSDDAEQILKRLVNSVLMDNGGPRDRKFRESVLTMVVLLQQIAVKSELLPNEALDLLQAQTNKLISGLRATMVAEGIEIPGSACRERLMKYPDVQYGIMFEHGNTVPYENAIPKGYEEAFRATVGDTMTVHLNSKGSKPIVREDNCRADLESRKLFCVKCGKKEPFVSNLTGEFSAQMDTFRAAHRECR